MFIWDTSGIHEDLTTVYVPGGNNHWHPIITTLGHLAMNVDLGAITLDNASEWEARAAIVEQLGDYPTWEFILDSWLSEEPVGGGNVVWLNDTTIALPNGHSLLIPAGYYEANEDHNRRRYKLIWTRHIFERYAGFTCNVTPKTRPAFMKRVAGWLTNGKTPAAREKVYLGRDYATKSRAASIAKNVEEVPA